MGLSYLYREVCSTPGQPAIYPATQAALVGLTSIRNQLAGDVFSGGQLVFDAATNCQLIDNTTPRTRLVGRMYYAKLITSSTNQDFQVCYPISLCNKTSGGTNPFFANNGGSPSVLFKNTTDPGDLRLGRTEQGVGTTPAGAYNDGNFTLRGGISRGHVYEFVLIERGATGTIHWFREDGGNWRLLGLELISSYASIWKFQNSGAIGVQSAGPFVVAASGWTPTPLVQHSFSSVISPSDGTGQPETGGASLVAQTSGDLTIAASALKMNSDGTGIVIFEGGQVDASVWGRAVPFDGSVVGLILRAVDTSNYLVAKINSTTDTTTISKVVAGVETVLGTASANTTPDFFDLPSGTEQQMVFHSFGNHLRACYSPGCLHQNYVAVTDSTFNTATKVGVLVSKGAGVNSSTMSSFVAFKGRELLLPIDDLFYASPNYATFGLGIRNNAYDWALID